MPRRARSPRRQPACNVQPRRGGRPRTVVREAAACSRLRARLQHPWEGAACYNVVARYVPEALPHRATVRTEAASERHRRREEPFRRQPRENLSRFAASNPLWHGPARPSCIGPMRAASNQLVHRRGSWAIGPREWRMRASRRRVYVGVASTTEKQKHQYATAPVARMGSAKSPGSDPPQPARCRGRFPAAVESIPARLAVAKRNTPDAEHVQITYCLVCCEQPQSSYRARLDAPMLGSYAHC